MAITDVRELRSFEFSESLESKGKVTLQGSVDLLALHDSLPDFAALAEDSTSWPNLSGGKIPQVGDMRLIAGVLFKVKGRKFAFYKGDDADRAVKITLSYEAQKEDTEQPTPEEEDEESWQRLSVTTEQKECPLDDHGANGEFDNDPKSAKNSAGDPLDGLTENRCLLRFKYTNTKVATPNFNTLTKYVNTTNDQPFIGGARRTMLCLGYNAEYDDNNGDTLYVDEEGMLNGTDFGFKLFGRTFYGSGILYGSTIEGENCSVKTDIKKIKPTFVELKPNPPVPFTFISF